MSVWDQYPSNYRAREVDESTHAVCAGQSVAIVGLSGSGKSNLLGFIIHRKQHPPEGRGVSAVFPHFALVDCNRLLEASPQTFFQLVRRIVASIRARPAPEVDTSDEYAELEITLRAIIADGQGVCLLLDRFDALVDEPFFPAIAGSLRALRDEFKYQLTYVIATRQPLDPMSELAELFFGCTLWLGPLEKGDALWSAQRDAARLALPGQEWSQEALEKLVELTWGYPSLLRAACEAYATGAALQLEELRNHPAVTRRVAEFWADKPDEQALRASRLAGHPLLGTGAGEILAAAGVFSVLHRLDIDPAQLTAKEHLLLEYLIAHEGEVCEKDEIIHFVWPEDVIFAQGIRDESLAQLVRRLRVKIEPNPSEPIHIHTVPGRGYLLRQ